MAKTEFEEFIQNEIEKSQGRSIPVKASALERLFVRKAKCTNLHPNPDDEFCFPDSTAWCRSMVPIPTTRRRSEVT